MRFLSNSFPLHKLYGFLLMPGAEAIAILRVINAFGFFIVEGVLGLLIIHSKKLTDEFDDFT